MTATPTSLDRLYVGASGWSYPSWKPGFYPAHARPADFLAFYAQRFRTVELNTTAYRLPAEEQFRRWADQVPDGFRFAVKMPAYRLDAIGTFVERAAVLGDRLGPLRVVVQSSRDDGFLALLVGSLDPDIALAFDFRHDSWAGVKLPANAVRVDDLGGEAAFRYLRFRDPPYDDDALAGWADRVRELVADGFDVYCYFRHEQEPSAPRYAARLLELV